MNKLRLAVIVSSGLVGLTGFFVACGDDTVVSAEDSGTDAGTDQSSPDTGPTGDATPDAPVFPDAGLTLENYQAKLAVTLCKSLARCCFGDANLDGGALVDSGPDGGTYDQASCVDFYTKVGFESSNGEYPASNANLILNNAKGDECVAKIESLTCDTPGAMYTAVAQACFAAIVGKQTVGQPCTKSVECTPGNFCANGDGGTGVCAVLRAADAPCGDWFATDDPDNNAEFSGEACSYRGKGVDTGRYCQFADPGTGATLPQADWKCKTAGGVGANCATTPWCKDALCDDLDTFTCVSPRQFFAPTPAGAAAGCGKFAKP